MLFIFKYIACLNILYGQGHRKEENWPYIAYFFYP